MVKKHKTYSLRKAALAMLLVMITVIFCCLYSITAYYNGLLKEQNYVKAADSIEQYTQERMSEISSLETYLRRLCANDNNIICLNTSTDDLNLYHNLMCVYNTMSSNINMFPIAEGLFLYSPGSDQFVCCTNVPFGDTCHTELSDFFLEGNTSNLAVNYTNWQVLTVRDTLYFVRMINTSNGVIGAWINASTLSESFARVFPDSDQVFLMGPEQFVVGNIPYEDYTWEEAKKGDYQICKDPNENISYLEVSHSFISENCRIIDLTPLYIVDRQLAPVYARIALIILLLLAGVGVVVAAFLKLVDAPVIALSDYLVEIQSNEDAKIRDHDFEPEEIHQLNKVLNSMVNEIRGLRIRVYEEKLAQSELEIQLLKSQISPHFLINCLSAFTSLACARKADHDLIHRFSYVLSQHIRYTFSSKRTASLEKEFSHIDNYLELVSIRYPDSLSYMLELPKECRSASVVPMLILTLCENTVKYNMVLGQTLQILVKAEMMGTDEKQQIHITYIDSGSGYPEEVLEWNNHILEHKEQYREGQHIGIYNITRSIKLNFGELADICFSNEPGMGARTDIYLPYEQAEE